KLEFPATFVDKSLDDTNSFVEKLWAIRRIGQIIDELDLKGRNEELVKELVGLSAKHGVLTPYTSFLADETTDRHNVASNMALTVRSLRELEKASGESGIAQRAAKGLYRSAQAPRLAAAAPSAGDPLPAQNFYFDAVKDQVVPVNSVRNVGAKTFYRRGNRWID